MKNEDLLAENLSLKQEICSLKEQIKALQKRFFGRKSERFIDNPNQLYLPGLEPESEQPATETVMIPAHEKRKAKSTPTNSISYPEDLPIETTVIDLKDEEKTDKATGLPLIKIGEEISKRLAVKPGQFFIKQIIRYKYALKNNPDAGIKTPNLPDSILNRPSCDESFIADVIVKKFCDHLPLNRQSEILTRQKIYVSRQTLSNYVNKIGQGLTPLYNLMKDKVFSSGNIFVDETPVDELAPGKGKTDQGYVVTVVGGLDLDPKNRIYFYFPDRKHNHFNQLLTPFQGILHSDKYGAYQQLAIKKNLFWCPCWAHIRRKFIEAEGGDQKLRTLVLELIQRLFKIEEKASLLTKEDRLQLRKMQSVPLIDEIIKLSKDSITQVLPKSKMGIAFRYLLGLEIYLKNYTNYPWARMDNNVAERALRPIAIGRKNWLFVGSESSGQNTAILLTFAQTCRALKINPHEYFEDVLRRFQSHSFTKLDELLPENWIKIQK